ncbi:adenine deaminase [Chakrabartyella piscis]|uniref:adenine deaminase n=1 Tax=Chakrabartyella piscis TaxID=2918914 RepID=UPI0029584248|nr:adenine deaminase [Chakrabartyella piscis]
MSTTKNNTYDSIEKKQIISTATGKICADLVFKHATYVNVFSGELCTSDIAISGQTIVGMGSYHGLQEIDCTGKILLPGFLDGHIHLESSLVSPTEFAKAVIPHGTTTVVTDPHEIANVMGTSGISYMLEATEGLPLDVNFMLPSCVPATPLDESGAVLYAEDLLPFYKEKRVLGLAEMMDYISILDGENHVIDKITDATAFGKQIDGHAPAISGNDLNGYVAAGIGSDHECDSFESALEKLRLGQYIMIREGTAAQNLEALMPLLQEQYASRCMFCTDDKHPSDLLEKGHMDYIIKKAIALGANPITAIQVATHNCAQYFKLDKKGAIAPGYDADLVLIDSFEHFQIQSVYQKGNLVYDGNEIVPFAKPIISQELTNQAHDTFHVKPLTTDDFMTENPCGIIGLVAKEIVSTNEGLATAIDLTQDILKVAVVERHKMTGHIGIGYLKGYGLQSGAVATSVAHDSHNIIVVGTNECDMAFAVQKIIENKGGIVVVEKESVLAELPLSIAGLMSEAPLSEVNALLEAAKDKAIELGVSKSIDPFMTLSFMSLPVIPTLRLTTKGVFDVTTQKYI